MSDENHNKIKVTRQGKIDPAELLMSEHERRMMIDILTFFPTLVGMTNAQLYGSIPYTGQLIQHAEIFKDRFSFFKLEEIN